MREWNLTPADPYYLNLSADARFGPTDYADDQTWQVTFGTGDAPALAALTRYGGRVGLARILPLWTLPERVIYTMDVFLQKPVIRAFAPNYARIEAVPFVGMALTVEYWAMASQAFGARCTMHNTGDSALAFDFDIITQLIARDEDVPAALFRAGKTPLLSFRPPRGVEIGIAPAIILEGAPIPEVTRETSVKLASPVTLAPDESQSVRWVHAGKRTLDDSAALAKEWMAADWDAAFAEIAEAAGRAPEIETGRPDWDIALAAGQTAALRSFVGPTSALPDAAFVGARTPAQGFSPRGDGSDHNWLWSGSSLQDALLVVPRAAASDPALAKGALYNFTATQSADGFIDAMPGLAGQRSHRLAAPLLASIALAIYEYDEDVDFVRRIFPALHQLFKRWFRQDADGDGWPEWTDNVQAGFLNRPAFTLARWGQGADITFAETPDLAAYMIKEARSLFKLASVMGDKITADEIEARAQPIADALKEAWRGDLRVYGCRDRDTHVMTTGGLLAEGYGDEVVYAAAVFDPPERVLIKVKGGKDRKPPLSAELRGRDAKGREILEAIDKDHFTWYRGVGLATAQAAFSALDSVEVGGISRVYQIEVWRIDLSREDVGGLLPLWAESPGRSRAKAMFDDALTDPGRYWRAAGIPSVPATDPDFDPAADNGAGRAEIFFNTLLCEALVEYGRSSDAAELFTRIMRAQIETLRREKDFREAYNADTGEGIGVPGHVIGSPSVHLFLKVAGIRIVSAEKVYFGGRYPFEEGVTVRQHGVTVRRTKSTTTIDFPSGGQFKSRGWKWQAVTDPKKAKKRGKK